MLFRRDPHRAAASSLYGTVVAQSRRPVFYAAFGVPDTVDGRFDMVLLHAVLVLRRLGEGHSEDAGAGGLAQALVNVLRRDMDDSLREMGLGDQKVARQIKAMGQALMGRLEVYGAGLAEPDDTRLGAALHRNLFRGRDVAGAILAALAGYVRRQADVLSDQPLADLMAGQVRFTAPPAPPAAGAAGEGE